MAEPEAAYRHEGEGVDYENFVPEGGWDAYLWRNRDAINESIRKSEEEYARGHFYTLEEVMAEIKARARRRQARKAKKA